MLAALVVTIAAVSGAAGSGELPKPLKGHGGPVMAVAVVDAESALSAGFDNAVGFWDLRTGEPVWFDGHEAAVKSVLPLADDRAASAGDDFSIIVWDLASGEAMLRLDGHAGSVGNLAVSPDGARLASAGWDGKIGLWSLPGGTLLRWLEGHEAQVNDVAFTNGGATLVSASADGSLRRWRVSDGLEDGTIVRSGFGITTIVIDEGAGWIAYGGQGGRTRVLALEDGGQIADLTLGRRPVLAMALSDDGALLAVGDGEGHVMVVDTDGWSIVHDVRAAEHGPIWALDFTADGHALIAGGIANEAAILALDGSVLSTASAEPGFLKDPDTMPNGERQFRRKCSVCHTLTGGTARRAGPTLNGLFGRRAGTVEGYVYSQTLEGSDIVWTPQTLDALFDAGPDHFVPGSKMPMQRIISDADRHDLIEFLMSATRN